jgi:hypothetical protein
VFEYRRDVDARIESPIMRIRLPVTSCPTGTGGATVVVVAELGGRLVVVTASSRAAESDAVSGEGISADEPSDAAVAGAAVASRAAPIASDVPPSDAGSAGRTPTPGTVAGTESLPAESGDPAAAAEHAVRVSAAQAATSSWRNLMTTPCEGSSVLPPVEIAAAR